MLSKRIQNITPSVTVALAGQVTELQRQGVDIISFGVGEPDFGTPENISTAGKAAIDANFTKYTAVSGILPLREAICEKLLRDNDVRYSSDQISVGTGAKQPLFNSVQTLIDDGDEVLLPTPCWVSYVEMIKLAGGTPVLVPCQEDKGFALDIPALESAITPKTKAIIINTPNNPTGAVYSEQSLHALADLACRHDFYVISDEVYEKLIYSGKRHFCIASISPQVQERTVIINGFSKAYAMTGWRIGYAAAAKEIIKGINAYQGHVTSNTSSIAQYAAIEALHGPQASLETMQHEFELRRNFLLERLNSIRRVHCVGTDGAFYLMPNVSEFFGCTFQDHPILDSSDLAEYLLKVARIAVVPGSAFFFPHNLRISYSTSMQNLRTGMDRMEAALNKLR